MIRSAYLAAEGFEPPLAEELARAGVAVDGWHGRLALSPDPPRHAAWALDVWTAPAEWPAPSVKAAADALRAIQRNWAGYAAAHHRRSALIAERLPPVRARPLRFPEPAPASHLGAWTLLAPDRLLASPTKTSPFPNGEVAFVEDRTGPPSRAYLKLWEACTRLGAWPQPGETCLDLGASPGGWTWALAQLGAERAGRRPRPAGPGGRRHARRALAGGQRLRARPRAGRLAVQRRHRLPGAAAGPGAALDRGTPRHIVCTIKLQGDTDHDAADAFAAIPGGRLMHLHAQQARADLPWARPDGRSAAHPPPGACADEDRHHPRHPVPAELRPGLGRDHDAAAP